MRIHLLAAALAATLSLGCISALSDGLDAGTPAPELVADAWINADAPIALADLRGGPVLLEFWSKDCSPCRGRIDEMQAIQAEYAPRGLQLVTMHVSLEKQAPRQDADAVRRFVAEWGIEYPVAIDQTGVGFEDYAFGYLPHAVLIDAEGRVTWSGNLVFGDVGAAVEDMLGAPGE